MKKSLLSIGSIVLILFVQTYTMAAEEKHAKETTVNQKEKRKLSEKELVIDGNSAYRAKRYDEAIDFYKQAIAANPQSINAYYDLGAAYKKKNIRS